MLFGSYFHLHTRTYSYLVRSNLHFSCSVKVLKNLGICYNSACNLHCMLSCYSTFKFIVSKTNDSSYSTLNYTFVHFGVVHISKWSSPVAWTVKNLPALRKTQVQSLHREDPLEKEMATHSFVLAWRIPWAEMPDAWQATVHGVTKSQTQLSD